MKTFSQKTAEIKREWFVIDASTLPLGKLAVVIADKLMGKSKVTYTPHVDNGCCRQCQKHSSYWQQDGRQKILPSQWISRWIEGIET